VLKAAFSVERSRRGVAPARGRGFCGEGALSRCSTPEWAGLTCGRDHSSPAGVALLSQRLLRGPQVALAPCCGLG
jgi:hypothetical protein